MATEIRVDSARNDTSMLDLFRAIVSGRIDRVLELLLSFPHLANQAIRVGATRDTATPYFFEEIMHYVFEGDTALHVAAAAYQVEIVHELISKGASPAAKNRRGAEPLHYAADGVPSSRSWNPSNQAAVIESLIRAGANPNSFDKSGVGPLHRAVRTRSAAAVRALLANGADPRLKNKSGSTPLHLAVQTTGRGGTGSPQSRDLQREIILRLLQSGARPKDTDSKGKTVRDSVAGSWILDLLKNY